MSTYAYQRYRRNPDMTSMHAVESIDTPRKMKLTLSSAAETCLHRLPCFSGDETRNPKSRQHVSRGCKDRGYAHLWMSFFRHRSISDKISNGVGPCKDSDTHDLISILGLRKSDKSTKVSTATHSLPSISSQATVAINPSMPSIPMKIGGPYRLS